MSLSDLPPLSREESEALNKRRRRRAVALGLVLAATVVIFYLLTVFRMGPAILDRPL